MNIVTTVVSLVTLLDKLLGGVKIALLGLCTALMYMLLAVPTKLMISKQVICSSFISSMRCT